MKPTSTRRFVAAVAAGTLLTLAGCTADKQPQALKPAPAPEKIFVPGASCEAVATGPATANEAANETANETLPDLELPCLTGAEGSVNLHNINGRPTVIALWASWCGPCLKELPLIQAAYASRKVAVLGVNTEDPGTANVDLLGELKLSFPSVYDLAGRTLNQLPKIRRALPVTVFVDSTGAIRKVYQGVPFDEKTFAVALNEYLGVA